MNVLFLYHDPCSDGFLCRIIAQQYYEHIEDRNVTYAGVNPSCLTDDLSNILQDKTFDLILMFDVSLSPQHYKQLCKHSQHVEVFDHHESTLKAFKGVETPWLTFDNNRCGSHLAFRYFYGNDQVVPAIVRYIEVRDLWLFGTSRDLINSKEITTYLYAEWFRLPFDEPKNYYFFIFHTTEEFWEQCVAKGAMWLKHIDEAVDSIVNTMKQKTITIAGEKKQVLVAETSEYVSEIGDKVAKSYPSIDFALLWNFDAGKRIKISLRSNATRCNVNDVARQLWKGGGHAAAAGALISDETAKEEFLKQFA